MSLSHYAENARYLADDLLELLTFEEAEAVRDLFDQRGYDLVLGIPDKDAKALFVFLGKTPSQQIVQFQKLKGDDKLVFWVRARFLALASASALSVAEVAESHVRSSYRSMHRAIAQAVHPYPMIPSIEDLLGPKWA